MPLRSPDGVRAERTGWRCQEISERHRQWGYNCPAVDLDFVVVEYNHSKPVCIVEYKEEHAKVDNLSHPTYLALIELADNQKEPIPCFIATYNSDKWWFRVTPLNNSAKEYYKHVLGIAITEQRFVRSLFLMRKKNLELSDNSAIGKLNNTLPAEEVGNLR